MQIQIIFFTFSLKSLTMKKKIFFKSLLFDEMTRKYILFGLQKIKCLFFFLFEKKKCQNLFISSFFAPSLLLPSPSPSLPTELKRSV